ncbi:MAG TPA: M48 family metallopeptidase [Vicinamibacterales bacterium]|jgi:heat shock protein HtpX|nr:M48 family metallopeptidase [Vicinamibacterales bacterium]
MNLYDQQRSNRRKTWLVMMAFVAFLLVLGAGFDTFYIGAAGGAVPIGTLAALGFGSVSALASYFSGDRAVLLASHAQPIAQAAAAATSDDEKLRLRQLDNVVDEMAIAAGLPRPPVYIVPDPDPNAFATGRGPGHASIAVTRGLLESLDRDQLQGVIAHEMSHVKNYDVRMMTVVAALVGAIALLSDWARRGMWWGGGARRRDRDDRGGGAAGAFFFVVWLAAVLIAPLLAQLLAMMVSRRREYLADASGAELTRNPLGLASALEKIDAAVEPTRAINQGTAHLCIADPLGRQMNVAGGRWSNLFASHPPMASRIAALKAMAYQGTTP